MRFRTYFTPEQNLARASFLSLGPLAKTIGEAAGWMITGGAAILGAVLVNADEVAKAVTANNLRWGLIAITLAFIPGGIAKQLGDAITCGYDSIEALHDVLDAYPSTIAGTIDAAVLERHVLEGHRWPLKPIMRRAFKRGKDDVIAGEKTISRLLTVQMVAVWMQTLTVACGLICIAVGIK